MSSDHIHAPRSIGESFADTTAAVIGSWRFLIFQTVGFIGWIAFNSIAVFHHFDAFPYILLNLCLSTQAFYAAPLILMAQNRQSSKDRIRDDSEADEVHGMFQHLESQDELMKSQHQAQLDALRSIDDKTSAIIAALTHSPKRHVHRRTSWTPSPQSPSSPD